MYCAHMKFSEITHVRVRKCGGSDNFGHENSWYRFVFGYLVYTVQEVGGFFLKVPKTVSRDGVSTLSTWAHRLMVD